MTAITKADLENLVASFIEDATTGLFRNGFVLYLMNKNANNLNLAASELDLYFQKSDSSYVSNNKAVSRNMKSLITKVSNYKKRLNANWHRIQHLLKEPAIVPKKRGLQGPAVDCVADTSVQDKEISPPLAKKLCLSIKEEKMVEHHGSCHCEAVKFKVLAPENVDVFECNCSICTKKQNFHFIVPKTNFTLLQGEDNLTTYTFNKKLAKHTFCKTCGVQSFYTPRSNQDGVGIMPHCIDSGTIKSTNVKKFDGQNWEGAFSNSNISKYSKNSDEEPV